MRTAFVTVLSSHAHIAFTAASLAAITPHTTTVAVTVVLVVVAVIVFVIARPETFASVLRAQTNVTRRATTLFSVTPHAVGSTTAMPDRSPTAHIG